MNDLKDASDFIKEFSEEIREIQRGIQEGNIIVITEGLPRLREIADIISDLLKNSTIERINLMQKYRNELASINKDIIEFENYLHKIKEWIRLGTTVGSNIKAIGGIPNENENFKGK